MVFANLLGNMVEDEVVPVVGTDRATAKQPPAAGSIMQVGDVPNLRGRLI
jgi:hypothetical protein